MLYVRMHNVCKREKQLWIGNFYSISHIKVIHQQKYSVVQKFVFIKNKTNKNVVSQNFFCYNEHLRDFLFFSNLFEKNKEIRSNNLLKVQCLPYFISDGQCHILASKFVFRN